ncbi:hypothetical protein B14911_27970 [Bacillus sp. NRRL B-14911]|nr:hypothetical protein B14911_27970 [Bacillus sp. NRRL B-14911]
MNHFGESSGMIPSMNWLIIDLFLKSKGGILYEKSINQY